MTSTPEFIPQQLPFYTEQLTKPDGRALTLYGLRPISINSEISSPSGERVEDCPELRWHPLRAEWVMYAAHRMSRTFLPPPQYNPLAPTTDAAHPSELPRGRYDMAVFDNRFPSLSLNAPAPPRVSGADNRAGRGKCEVVVFSQDASGTLGGLEQAQIELLLHIWAERTTSLAQTGDIQSVLAFENRGVEVGVTLHHPHGQIYAYDHIPPVQARSLASAEAYLMDQGSIWLPDFVAKERQANLRIVLDAGEAISVVPPFARYAYETWVMPSRAAALLSDLSATQITAFAHVLKDALLRLDALFGMRMPYLLTLHQAPLDQAYPAYPLHIEIYPYLRSLGKLKYLAGTEQGAGEFANDLLPEQAAQTLRALSAAQS